MQMSHCRNLWILSGALASVSKRLYSVGKSQIGAPIFSFVPIESRFRHSSLAQGDKGLRLLLGVFWLRDCIDRSLRQHFCFVVIVAETLDPALDDKSGAFPACAAN